MGVFTISWAVAQKGRCTTVRRPTVAICPMEEDLTPRTRMKLIAPRRAALIGTTLACVLVPGSRQNGDGGHGVVLSITVRAPCRKDTILYPSPLAACTWERLTRSSAPALSRLEDFRRGPLGLFRLDFWSSRESALPRIRWRFGKTLNRIRRLSTGTRARARGGRTWCIALWAPGGRLAGAWQGGAA